MSDDISLDNFKKWIKTHNSDHAMERPEVKKPFLGLEVVSKVGLSKLEEKISTESNVRVVAEKFLDDGGIIVDTTDDKHFFIETGTEKFKIHRAYVKKA